ncbi:hypothetical protein Y695_03641 [Hydrogenophaga sp. T4]|nr:hypothetical protein Y695_03641 [Hydrogenophaga sp. T4]
MVSSVGRPQGMLEAQSISSPAALRLRTVYWCTSVSSVRQLSTLSCTPVISSSCDSL